MNIEQQVVSLEYAKRLCELGVKQSSLFFHAIGGIFSRSEALPILDINYSAFTVAELGQLLPNSILLPTGEPFNHFRIVINKFISVDENNIHINNWIINYECDTTSEPLLFTKLTKNIYDPNLANAMARMLIYLIENKFKEIKCES